ncbi:MAG: FHA domain-containing protein, partial [Planctomycetota bacterium]
MGKFVVRNGEFEGRRFRLEAGAKIILGRELADLNFPDKRMSRRHCSIEAREDGDHVHDFGSTNGTWLNSQRISDALLTPGDLVRVGFTELEYLGAVGPSSTAVAADEELQQLDPRKTVAFRAKTPIKEISAEHRRHLRSRSRIDAAKSAAMGKPPKDTKRGFISAKGKFCEACGESIFLKQGAPDEGKEIDGLYLCRMCALIAEKQKDMGQDFLPSYAKIVGGRMPNGAAGDAPDSPAAPAPGGEIEVTEQSASIDEFLQGEPGAATDAAPVGGAPRAPEAADPAAGGATVKPSTDEEIRVVDGPAPPGGAATVEEIRAV